MARTYSRATHQTAALVLFQTGQPQLLVFGVRLGVFAGLNLSAVIPGEPKNWDKSLPIAGLPDLGTDMDQAGSAPTEPEPEPEPD